MLEEKRKKIDGAVLDIPGFGKVRLKTGYYYGTDRLAILVDCVDDGEPYGVLTVNIPKADLATGEILVKTWSENEALSEAARNCGLFADTGRREPTGFVYAEYWEVL